MSESDQPMIALDVVHLSRTNRRRTAPLESTDVSRALPEWPVLDGPALKGAVVRGTMSDHESRQLLPGVVVCTSDCLDDLV